MKPEEMGGGCIPGRLTMYGRVNHYYHTFTTIQGDRFAILKVGNYAISGKKQRIIGMSCNAVA
ncbi:hypothetical protein SMB34_16620 [Thalassospira permensis NBRC 106175]|uniref:Uncharacterized protein n=1 Tax=Thalassospira permensis NBRC 106175 TaxID=1353532 RepID=A0ABR4TP38_9PROT|nr:hypothetical protein SMB34_16620 [Thalassospira permensis NBRC 106175]